jgi:hypothetical protein
MKYTGPELDNSVALAVFQGSPRFSLEIYVDWDRRTVEFVRRLSGDTCRTAEEFHDHAWSHPIATLTADDARCLLRDLDPLLEEIARECHEQELGDQWGRQAEWDSDWYHDRLHGIEVMIDRCQIDPEAGLWSAWDYFEAEEPALAETMASILDDAHGNGVHLYDVEEYLDEIRGAG